MMDTTFSHTASGLGRLPPSSSSLDESTASRPHRLNATAQAVGNLALIAGAVSWASASHDRTRDYLAPAGEALVALGTVAIVTSAAVTLKRLQASGSVLRQASYATQTVLSSGLASGGAALYQAGHNGKNLPQQGVGLALAAVGIGCMVPTVQTALGASDANPAPLREAALQGATAAGYLMVAAGLYMVSLGLDHGDNTLRVAGVTVAAVGLCVGVASHIADGTRRAAMRQRTTDLRLT